MALPEIYRSVFEQRFDMLMRDVTDYGIIVTDADGNVVDWSAGAEQIFGYIRIEVLGKSARLIFTSEDRDHGVPELEMSTARATGRAGDDRLHVTKSGAYFMASGVLTAIRDEAGEVEGFVKVVRDVTQLANVQKAESVAALAAGVAHRFNNLLTIILGHTSLVLEELPSSSSHRNMLQQVMDAGYGAAELTRQLLAYAGKGLLIREVINLSALVESRRRLLRSITMVRELHFELDAAVPNVTGDSKLLEQVLVNLVVNASEATETRGHATTITSTGCELTEEDIESLGLQGVTAGLFACLTVTDSGCGMDEKTLTRIFQPFFSTKFLGRGLGLAAVKGIVQQHKGTVHVTSKLGMGSRVIVYLPAYEPSKQSN